MYIYPLLLEDVVFCKETAASDMVRRESRGKGAAPRAEEGLTKD